MPLIYVEIESVTNAKLVTGTGNADQILERPMFQACGFTSIPKAGTLALTSIERDQVIVIGTQDTVSDRPVLSSEKDVAIYADADKYIKISADGEIEASNGFGKIILKADGDIELGNGNLKNLINSSFQAVFNDHVHNFIAAPSGAFSTSKPVVILGTEPVSSIGGAVATFDSRITNIEMTSVTKAK